MVFIFLFFILPLILLCGLDVFSSSARHRASVYGSACLYILIFSYTLVQQSGDFINYRESFENVNSWREYIAGSTLKGYAFEPGFLLVYFLIKYLITTDGNTGVTIVTLLSGAGLLYFIPKYTRYFFIALLVYIAHFYWWLGIVLLRQMCAMVILFPVIGWIQETKWKKSLIVIGGASLFHASALIFCLFLGMKKLCFFKYPWRVVALIGIVFLFGYMDILKVTISLVSGYIPRGEILMNYLLQSSNRSMNLLAFVEMLVILGIALKYRARLQQDNRYTEIAIELLIGSLLLGGLFYRYEIGMRFVLYFNFYSFLILLPSFIAIVKQDWINRSFYVGLLVSYLCVFLIRFVYITL